MKFDEIKAALMAARVARSADTGVLSTLVGEIQTATKKFDPARDMNDAEVVAIVGKFLKNNAEAAASVARLPEGRREVEAAKLAAERAVLEVYVPGQMSEADIEAFAAPLASEGMDMGRIMSALKTARPGAYDGKLASAVVKRVLAG